MAEQVAEQVAELSIISDLIFQIGRLQMAARAADRALLRLSHPTIDPEAVPEEIINATVFDLRNALAELPAAELEGIPAAGPLWSGAPQSDGLAFTASSRPLPDERRRYDPAPEEGRTEISPGRRIHTADEPHSPGSPGTRSDL